MQQRLEAAAGNFGCNGEEKKRILERLTAAEGLERYLGTKYAVSYTHLTLPTKRIV